MTAAQSWSPLLRVLAPLLLLCSGALHAACGGDNGVDTSTFPADASTGDDGASDDASQNNDGGVIFGDGGDGQTSGDGGNNCVAPVSLAVAPPTTTAMVTVGTAFTQSYTVTATYSNQATSDVTSSSFFTISDPNVGTFNASAFRWGGVYGGVFTVRARHCGITGTATLTLDLRAIVGTGGDGGVDAGGASGTFMNAPPSNVAGCAPTIVYPADGVLIPPNTNVIEVHFLEGSPPNTLFEISFSNSVTDVRVYTTCTGATAADGMPLNGGCVFELSQAEWNYVAQTNRDGDPVTVKVRGLGCDGGNVASSATRQISFAKEDMVGALYYWASMRILGNVNSGGIFRYDYGVRGQSAFPVLTPNSSANPTGLCIGCHTVSRDGRQMIFDFDDNDDDDEYGDVRTDIYDIAAARPAQPIVKNGVNDFPPGYHTWDRAAKQFLLTDGPGNTATPAGALRRVATAGTTLGYTRPGTLRATTPDWAPDDSSVVFAAPPSVSANPPSPGFWQNGKDLWFAGASLYTAPWDANTNTLGAPTQLIAASGGSNLYYPSYSPDKSFISFNSAVSGPNFHNPLARVQLVVAGQTNPVPVDLAKLNTAGTVTNSWARWAPFVQSYKGGKILWLTMSSTRDYGLRILNSPGKQNCYPTESPIAPFFNNTANCTRAQLWFAAIRLDTNGVIQGNDVSYPAFWLPFQDITTNNHLAQWAQKSFTGTCGGADAGADAGMCAPGLCCDNGGCGTCPNPPPPPATCSTNANCSPGQCCSGGACGGCSNDGGTSDAGPPGTPCQTCLDCNGQACNGNACGSCSGSADCCAPLLCQNGQCVPPPR